MSQVSLFLRRTECGFTHWCPGCEKMHPIGDGWNFDGDLSAPTFFPSVKHTGVQTVVEGGHWTGEFVYDEKGKPVPYCCHYFLTRGKLQFQRDCTHVLGGMTVPLPVIPVGFRDG